MRHLAADRSVWVRTFPVTFLHDVTQDRRDPDWHQLTFATRGQLEVITDDARRFVPPDRAVWVPAGVRHTSVMRAPISMRSIFVAARVPDLRIEGPGSAGARSSAKRCGVWIDRVRTVAVSPLLRELILHVTRLGALDRRRPEQHRLALVLFDLLATAEDVPLELPTPRDPRARRFAELVTGAPGDERSTAALARAAGASLRTIERCLLAETGVPAGEWRRRVRLFHARRLLEAGGSATQVAYEVGYASVSAFSQAFARQFGCSPSRRR